MSDRYVLGLPSAALDRANHHFAVVDPDPDLQIDAFLRAKLLGVVFEDFLHAECGEQCALWVILMRDGRPKECEDAFARGLRDITAVAMDRVHHQLERGSYYRPGVVRVEVLDQLYGALDVREQRGDRLALAVDRCGLARFRRRERFS